MKRRSSAAEETVSLFPFLAVLLCTMGTLALIFAIASQNIAPDGSAAAPSNARQAPNAEYDAALAQTDGATIEELEAETESLVWFTDELNAVQTRTQAALEKERERLAAAEKSLADLRSEATVAKKRLETLRSETIADPAEDALALQEKIDALDAEIERLQTETKKLREKNTDAKRSYAILPYQGKKGVFRRPIYVECNERGVFLQPEGVPFLSTDFLLARYPGNPFDAGLRAASRRFVELNGEKTADGETVEPYPLLIIRPGGANRYYAAVAALASWGGDFGYEFVADDQEIVYPEPDPVLAAAVREQTEFSRRRLAAQLTALLSARNASTSFAGAASRSGGIGGFGGKLGSSNGGSANGDVPASALQARLGSQVKLGSVGGLGGVSGSNVLGGAPKVAQGNGNGNGNGNGFAANVSAAPNASNITTGVGAPVDAGFALGSVNASGADGGDASNAASGVPLPRYSGYFAQFLRPAPSADVSSTSSDAQTAPNSPTVPNAPSEQLAQNAPNAPLTQGSQLVIPNAAAQTTQTLPPPQNAETAQGSPSPQNASTPFLAQLQGTPQTAQNAQTTAAPKIDARQTLGNTTFGAGATGSSSVGTLADSGSGATSTRVEATEPKKTNAERSNARENPNAIRISDELRRPSQQGLERGIRVLCSADQIVFPKQPGLRAATTVSLAADASLAAVERELSDAIVFCVKSWGVAGRNMYWAPFLKVEVASNGEERFRELSEFCRTQGLTVVRAD